MESKLDLEVMCSGILVVNVKMVVDLTICLTRHIQTRIQTNHKYDVVRGT